MQNYANQLKDKIAIVTGAGRGIGRAIAIGFARAGAAVCCSARTESDIKETVSEIKAFKGQAGAKVVDVADSASVQELYEFTKDTFGGIDLVIVNAGISLNTSIENSDPDDWLDVLQTNLFGAYLTARTAIPHLRARGGGKIIFIGSGLGHRGVINTSAYACSKAGVWMLTRVLAQEVVQDNISVNELIPGPVKTTINSQNDGELLAQLGTHEWLKTPEDVIPLALFLATQPKNGPTSQSFSLMRRDT